jgi:hypothetical protein
MKVAEKHTPERDKARPARRGWMGRLFSDVLFVVKREKRWWLLPLIILMLLLAALLIVAAASGPVAPFIYPFL